MTPPTEPQDPGSHERKRVALRWGGHPSAPSSSSPPKILVLGLGNDLLTDDAVGLHVARAVRARLADEPGVVVRETTEMGLALLDEIAGFDGLVLVDSIQTGSAPAGHLHEFELDDLMQMAHTPQVIASPTKAGVAADAGAVVAIQSDGLLRRCAPRNDKNAAGRRLTAPHFVGVAETLALGRTLGLTMPREVRIIAIEVADPFTLGTRMSRAVEQTVEEVARCVIQHACALALRLENGGAQSCCARSVANVNGRRQDGAPTSFLIAPCAATSVAAADP